MRNVLILGSGALKIGEAGEFDYSGSQAAKALKEEGIKTILVNPNIATIQTSNKFIDRVYFLPVTPYFVEKIIAQERPEGILLGFGGQTALNCGLSLAKNGTFEKYGVKVLGTPVSSIEKTEDRLLFRKCIQDLGLKVPGSSVCTTTAELSALANSVHFPVIIRAGFSLGGLGSGVARTKDELLAIGLKALSLTPQILVEEYLEHWKEIEYEVVRDRDDNAITVCNMENLDPMGIHTGESVVVAPSQTLTNYEYHKLRHIAITVIKSLPIVGECNIQYALNPKNGDYRIIEVNARLSRSSALASKATGYPLAYVAAKLALGYTLSEIPNRVTRATCAFFEPALDYIVVKIPRWDFFKFTDRAKIIGSEMQSVGEVMSIGRTFEEAFQKAIRSLNIDFQGVISEDLLADSLKTGKPKELKNLDPQPDRPYHIAYNLFFGQSLEEIYKITGIDYWFLERIYTIVAFYRKMLKEAKKGKPSRTVLSEAKNLGFSDAQIAEIFSTSWKEIRTLRKNWQITPKICQIDTLAGEFPAITNYLYMSYHRIRHDIKPGLNKKQVIVLGGGPYQIGSSVEFDWCAVNTVLKARELGFSPLMINCNPETVSTDYDISDKLYFEELTLERVLDILDLEKSPVIVSMGGQIPNTLAPKLAKEGIKILGTTAETIDKAEDRQKFSAFLDKLNIEQPIWKNLNSREDAINFAKSIGFPVLVRPSYVLSGRAMFTAHSQNALEVYLEHSKAIMTPDHPMVISKFLRGTKEVDFDGVAQNGEIVAWAISEHIEHAGVHSGDATLVLPSFSLGQKSTDAIVEISQKIAANLPINGPFNIQYLVSEETPLRPSVSVIEANLRASRSFPFVSKVLGENFIELATQILLGRKVAPVRLKQPPYFGVKVPHFSFTRLRDVDPILRVEMASTGEVACFGETPEEAYLKGILSTNMPLPKKSALLSLGGEEGKQRVLPAAKALHRLGFTLYATESTTKFLNNYNIPAHFVYKVQEKKSPNVIDLIKNRKVELVINLSDRSDLGMKEITRQATDGYLIRRATVDANIPLFTKATIANVFVQSLEKYPLEKLLIKPWDAYVGKKKRKESGNTYSKNTQKKQYLYLKEER